jgi:hypothetical protein
MPRWEYEVEVHKGLSGSRSDDDGLQRVLAPRGADGWELVSVLAQHHGQGTTATNVMLMNYTVYTCVFKRKVRVVRPGPRLSPQWPGHSPNGLPDPWAQLGGPS